MKERLLTPARWLQWGGGAGKTSSITSKYGVRRPVLPYARPPLTSNRSESSFVGERGEKKVSQMDYCGFLNFTFLSLPSLLKVYVYVAVCQFLLINNRPWKEGTSVFHIYFISIMISLSRQSAHI